MPHSSLPMHAFSSLTISSISATPGFWDINAGARLPQLPGDDEDSYLPPEWPFALASPSLPLRLRLQQWTCLQVKGVSTVQPVSSSRPSAVHARPVVPPPETVSSPLPHAYFSLKNLAIAPAQAGHDRPHTLQTPVGLSSHRTPPDSHHDSTCDADRGEGSKAAYQWHWSHWPAGNALTTPLRVVQSGKCLSQRRHHMLEWNGSAFESLRVSAVASAVPPPVRWSAPRFRAILCRPLLLLFQPFCRKGQFHLENQCGI